MAVPSVDLDPRLLARARELTGERSNRAVLHLALRRLIAAKQKGAMLDGVADLADLPTELGSPAGTVLAADDDFEHIAQVSNLRHEYTPPHA